MILACRDESRGNEAAEDIKQITKSKKVVVRTLDLASFQSVVEFAATIKKGEWFICPQPNGAEVSLVVRFRFQPSGGKNSFLHLRVLLFCLQRKAKSISSSTMQGSSATHRKKHRMETSIISKSTIWVPCLKSCLVNSLLPKCFCASCQNARISVDHIAFFFRAFSTDTFTAGSTEDIGKSTDS